MNNNFDLDILKYIGKCHQEIMINIDDNINNFDSNKELYYFIDNYFIKNNLNKAFPIGISINNIIAHDSWHPNNYIKFKNDDYIKVDIGIIQDGNIVDGARTYQYKNQNMDQIIYDSEEIINKTYDFIQKELDLHKKILIQKISTFISIEISKKNYNTTDYLGGHNIEKNIVHGKKLILNKPLHLLPTVCKELINKNDYLSDNEMFALEIYICNNKNGYMYQNNKKSITHYEINKEINLNENININEDEKNVYKLLIEKTKLLPYDYKIHDNMDKKIIKKLIEKNIIKIHYPLEWSDIKTKFVQYEDTFIIIDNKLINLTKK